MNPSLDNCVWNKIIEFVPSWNQTKSKKKVTESLEIRSQNTQFCSKKKIFESNGKYQMKEKQKYWKEKKNVPQKFQIKFSKFHNLYF